MSIFLASTINPAIAKDFSHKTLRKLSCDNKKILNAFTYTSVKLNSWNEHPAKLTSVKWNLVLCKQMKVVLQVFNNSLGK